MKKLLAIILIFLMLTGCKSVSKLPDGTKASCVGINDRKNPNYLYEYSARNIIIGVLFVELIVPPVMVVLNNLQCPVDYVGLNHERHA